jgi:opacity protein-like surface antigen
MNRKWTSALFLGMLNLPVHSQEPCFNKVISLSGGAAISSPGRDQTLTLTTVNYIPILGPGPTLLGSTTLTTFITNTYSAITSTQTTATGEAFFALQWALDEFTNNQLGIGIGAAGDVTERGTITVNGTPSLSGYEYKVDHTKLVLRDKMIFGQFTSFQPYITGALGTSFNTAHSYITSPPINQSVSAPDFTDKTNSFGFTYSVGCGVQKNINPNWSVALGYEFEDWGTSGLGEGAFGSQTSVIIGGTPFVLTEPLPYNGPHGHITSNNISFTMSYQW